MKPDRGQLELICGPMFAGKTTLLLDRFTQARDAGRTVEAIKPAQDTRYGTGRIVSHNGTALDAKCVTHAGELVDAIGNAEVVGIDEVHFFDATLAEVCNALVATGCSVIVAGVDLDQRGQPFDVMAALERDADVVKRLTATCVRCGAEATHTQRLIESDARIAVGGKGDYEPRCKKCFQPNPKTIS